MVQVTTQPPEPRAAVLFTCASMEPPVGFEPTTYALQMRYSTVELCPYMVPGMGFEPIRQRRRILNPLCLPVPPTRHLCACRLNYHTFPPAGKYFTSLWECSFQRPLSFFMGICATPISAGSEPATGDAWGNRTHRSRIESPVA